ncbi:PLP-dependent aminotransferase family protein [Virgibacillus halophilus]
MEPPVTKVAVENPGYPRIYKLLNNLNMNITSIHLDNQGVIMDEVKKADPNFLFITPSHQFPTGTIMPISRRIQLLNWVTNKDENHYIVEDDYDSEFIYNSDYTPSLYSLSNNDKVIYLGSFSKTLLPSFRISYMVLPPKLLEKYKRFFSDWTQECNLLQLYTLYHFIDSGEYQKHIKKMNKYYNNNRTRMINALQALFKEKVYIHDIPAGLHFLATFYTNKSYDEVIQKAKEEKLEIYTLQRYSIKMNKHLEKGKIKLIIGFSSMQEDIIPKTLKRLYNVLYSN